MRVVMVADWRKHVFHPILIAKASRALIDGNRWEFEAVLRQFESNYFMEGLIRSGEESFFELIQKYLFLGTIAGFHRIEDLVEDARNGGIRFIEVGDPYLPFYTAGILFLNGRPIPREIVRKLPDPVDFRDEDYLRFLLMLFEHNHRFGIVSCAFEFRAIREALYEGILRQEEPEIWRDRGCFVGIVPGEGDPDGVHGDFKIACRGGWCVFYFRGSRKRLKEKLKEHGLSLPSGSSPRRSPPHSSSASSRRTR